MRNVRLKYFATLQVFILALTGCMAIGLGPAKVRIAEIVVTTDKPDAEVYRVDQDGNEERLGSTDDDGYYTDHELFWKEGLYLIKVGDKGPYSWTPQIDVKGKDVELKGSTLISVSPIPNPTLVLVVIEKCNVKSAFVSRINSEEWPLGVIQNYCYKKLDVWDEGDYRIKVTQNDFEPWVSEKYEVKGKNRTIKIPKVTLKPKK